MKKSKAKAIFAVISISASTLLALVTTYLYGAFHQHDRYWEKTIAGVNERQAKVLGVIFTQVEFRELALEDPVFLREIFDPLYGHLNITVTHENITIFDNLIPDRDLKAPLVDIIMDDLAFTVEPYEPPKWSRQFISWMFSQRYWFERNRDFITYPFLTFLCIYLITTLAFGWRLKANHLENNVLERLRGN